MCDNVQVRDRIEGTCLMLSAPAPPLSRPALTASRAVIYQLLQDRINIGKEMLQISPIDPIEFDNFIEFNIDVLKAMFTNDIIVYEYINSFGPGSLGDKLRRLTNKLESIRDRLDFYTEPGAQAALVMQAPTPRDLSAAAPRDHSKIFVVHGHDGGPKAEVAR